jgi:hypothetical protein
MTKKTLALISGGVVAAAVLIVVRARTAASEAAVDDHWRVVTVNRPFAGSGELATPAPLAELGDQIEVLINAAPGDNGIEIQARPSPGTGRDDDLVGRIRRALRESKQIIEVGHVMTNHPQPEGHRPSAPTGLVVDSLVRRSPEAGVL